MSTSNNQVISSINEKISYLSQAQKKLQNKLDSNEEILNSTVSNWTELLSDIGEFDVKWAKMKDKINIMKDKIRVIG